MRFILILLFLLIGCGKKDSGVDIEKETPISVLQDNLASLEYEYSSLASIAGTSLNNCNQTSNNGKLIQTLCSFKDESNAALKFQLVSQIVSFTSFLYPGLQTLRTDIELLNNNNSLNQIEKNNRILYLQNTISDFYTRFNFISNTVSDTDSAITALQNATINTSNTQDLITLLQNQVDTIEDSITDIEAEIASLTDVDEDLQAQLDDLNDDLATLSDTLDTAQTDIGNLKTDTDSILKPELIGAQNLGAGPLYELILRRDDKRQVIGYNKQNASLIRLPSNPLATVNASSTVTITTSAAHNLAVGKVVRLSGLAAGANFTTGQLNGEYVVRSIVSTTKFTITLSTNASATSAGFGGNSGGLQEVFVDGMIVLWTAGQVSDTAVRQTSMGTTLYNYIIRRISTDTTNNSAEICYDKTNATATFAVINAAPVGGTGNIVCL